MAPAKAKYKNCLSVKGPIILSSNSINCGTFTRPVEPAKQVAPATLVAPAMPIPQPPLIEAEPHQKPAEPHQKPIDAYREPRPQYIMRPSGAPPTDSPENVLDLRKDKGEF